MATMLYRKQRAEIGFAGSMPIILTWVTRSVKIDPGRLRTVNCSPLLDEDDTQSQKMLAKQLGVLKQSFPCGFMPWGRFKRLENGCRMNWTIGRWSDAKTHAKFCLLDKSLARKKKVIPASDCDRRWKVDLFSWNPKRKKSWIDPAQPSTSSSRLNRFRRNTILCVWWDQESVIYYELLKPDETVNAYRYHQQLIKLHRALREKRPHYWKWHDKLIFLHDNAPSHTSTIVQNYLETLDWEVLPPRLLIWHLLTIICFRRWATRSLSSSSILTKTKMTWWFASKNEEFFWRGIHKLPERWEKCIISEGKYFEWICFCFLEKKNVFFWLKNSGFKLIHLVPKTRAEMIFRSWKH